MNIDEMKNRISMALKDPILQQGFEIICKNLAELEKSIQKKKFIIDQLNVQLAEFEKENAELKNQLEMGNKVYNDNLYYSHHIEESLTQAKETIRMVIDSYKHKERFSFEKDLIKAEQFLNNEVEK
jgi:septal ring factor EnvC (AmiA/AmiB activator)